MNAESEVLESPRLQTDIVIGVVVIGRNEGKRLKRCLESIVCQGVKVIYVDSGSTDDSVKAARSLGTEVVELDMLVPFCASRARNAGYRKLVEACPQVSHVQFVDGDCELVDGWLTYAVESLLTRPDHAIVTGWLREKSPQASIYNRLGDLEWNFASAGPVEAVGGIFMIRREAFDAIGGFDPTIAAGEEPELCQRLTQREWRLVKLDREMARHDLAMTRFAQWWRRMMRNGYASMDGALRFGIPKSVKNNFRLRLWTAWLISMLILGPATAVVADTQWLVLLTVLIFSIWPIQVLRIAFRTWRKGQPLGASFLYAFFTLLSVLPQLAGQVLYFVDRARNSPVRLVEYKNSTSAAKNKRQIKSPIN